MLPEVATRHEDGEDRPLLVWRLPRPRLAIASGPLGGGIGLRSWVVNAEVAGAYRRHDPDDHLLELAAAVGLGGRGVGLLTAARVRGFRSTTDDGVVVTATVGLTHPILAAASAVDRSGDGSGREGDEVGSRDGGTSVGTINVVAVVPARLSEAALVNAVATVAEAKAQALADSGLRATGTPTDALCVLCDPDGGADPFGGPRSRWGAPLARAVHAAVLAGSGGLAG